ncbi:hypothetical protein HN873_015015 [Arachis hypogaea]
MSPPASFPCRPLCLLHQNSQLLPHQQSRPASLPSFFPSFPLFFSPFLPL